MREHLDAAVEWMRRELSPPADEILERVLELARETAGKGLIEHEKNLNRSVLAARDLKRRIKEILNAGNPVVAKMQNQPTDLARTLRHDLRNVVGSVKGYLEIVEEDFESTDDVAFMAQVSKLIAAAASLDHQIGDIVDFADSDRPADASEKALPPSAEIPFEPVERSPNDIPITGRVLVVDDEESNREIISTRLRRDGHRVSQAADGAEALELMQRREFDLVLLDLMMPGVDGFAVMAEMQKSSNLRNISIIVISALEQEENAIRSITLGATDYLSKPVNPILLRARIVSCLARKQWRDQERIYRMHLEAEKDKSEALLLNTLPALVIKRLTSGEKVIADAHEEATVLFSDFVDFTGFAGERQPREVVEILNRVYTEFDDLGLDLGVEKIKTIGDGYLACAGLPLPRPDHADVMADMALGMIDILESVNRRLGTNLEMRIGLHSGPVVAGVIGAHKFAYDVWGHTVNMAARHESYSLPQHVHVSADTANLLQSKFELTSRGRMTIRGLGSVETFFLGPRVIGATQVAKHETAREAGDDGAFAVLIADDDETARELMARRIRRRGWEADVAADGKEAWDRIQNRTYDLLITDCDMPDVDGFELTRRIRHVEDFTDERTAIIALTGSDGREVAERCLATGMDAFLKKPVMWRELENCVLRVKGGHRDTTADLAVKRPMPLRESGRTHTDPPPPARESAQVLDLSSMKEIFGTIDSQALDALRILENSVAESVRELIDATRLHEFDRAAKLAHSLMGAAKTAGAMELADVCMEVKSALAERDLLRIARAGDRIAAADGRLRARIESLFAAKVPLRTERSGQAVQ